MQASQSPVANLSPALLIGDAWIGTPDRDAIAVTNPATEEEICRVPVATDSDISAALSSANEAFGTWRGSLPIERSRILRQAAQILRERLPEIALGLTMEQGKILAEARAEVTSVADLFDWFAEEARRIYSRGVANQMPGLDLKVVSEPVGPIAAFATWNFPALVPARKIAAAIAAGCTIVIKPAEETPNTAVALGRALRDAGLPPGVLNILFGNPDQISSALLGSPIIRKLSVTGSTGIGKILARHAAESVMPGIYELGGHAPAIVFEDADVDKAARVLAASKFRNAGQACLSPSRFLVHEGIHDAFVDRMVRLARALKVGDGQDEGNTMGALTNSRRLTDVQAMVDDAVAKGAQLQCGGNRIGNKGYFFAPTVLTDVPDDALAMAVEPFGPVVPVQRFKLFDDAIAKANALPFGLASYVFTNSNATMSRAASQIEAGLVGVNSCAVSHHESPLGGVKQSGHGREGGIEGLEAYLVKKLIATDTTV
ncbi:NAD-dependent succinate-semialdehyde dehydrogenase [Mesorhizobium sp. 1M-11]|uniref:NAD-dependent succinate-semialdehyde dehydrogenase n=1 Tax=Mesorhizobium sp. 1M-11 TaxID=1529006 RepID=UPI0006C75430|nr:NAD-dependent succinate-semialdehyde dehydrogenase [Mesorhizobium sp. 1M-11]